MKRMLINATQEEELRVALVDGQVLYDLDIERPGREQKKANIYSGIIRHLETSLDAAFVDYGAERHGFLPFKEIVLSKEQQQAIERGERLGVRDVLREGQQVLVQVEKEERGNKGAALTTFISLAGCYLVLMPNNPGAGGISRRIDGDDRQDMKDALSQLKLPEGMGMIIRTAGVGRSIEELQWDLDVQMHLWDAIQNVYKSRSTPLLIHQESDVVMRSIRDYLRRDISEIVIDNTEIYERAKKHIEIVRPDFIDNVKLYTDRVPLFTRFHIESQIESAYQREVRLPSGGAIVIDHTEALVSIDINSAKATRGGDIEETALHTNLEAAEEIARQLRLRDIGGLVVIDFIDMGPIRNQREVENRLREATKMDRARIQVGRLSRFGLLEMSRQRLRPSLGEASLLTCPRCHGSGVIRGIESLALSVLRLVEENAMKEKTKQLRVQVPIEVATYILNEKRDAISKMEECHRAHIIIVPNPHYVTPNFKIDRIRQEESAEGLPSYQMVNVPEADVPYEVTEKNAPVEQPAVKALETVRSLPNASAKKAAVKKEGVLTKLWHALFAREPEPSKAAKPTHERGQRNNNQRNRSGGNGGGRGRRASQGMSVKDVVKQQSQTESRGNARSQQSSMRHEQRTERPEKVQETAAKRDHREPREPREQREPRRTRPVTTPDDTVVVKIPAAVAKVEVPVVEKVEERVVSPVVQEAAPQVTETPVQPKVVARPVVVEPARGEDIFAKAQRMLAAQTVAAEAPVTNSEPAKAVETVAAEVVVQAEPQQAFTLTPERIPAEESQSEPNVDAAAGATDDKTKQQNRFRHQRGNQRMHGKHRRGYGRRNNGPRNQDGQNAGADVTQNQNSNEDKSE